MRLPARFKLYISTDPPIINIPNHIEAHIATNLGQSLMDFILSRTSTAERQLRRPMSVDSLCNPSEQENEPLVPSFATVSVPRASAKLGAIILGNCVTMALLVVLLLSYSKKSNLERTDKRIFNTAAIFLSAALSLGIGYLLDTLGLIGRGYILVSSPHSRRAVSSSFLGYKISIVNTVALSH